MDTSKTCWWYWILKIGSLLSRATCFWEIMWMEVNMVSRLFWLFSASNSCIPPTFISWEEMEKHQLWLSMTASIRTVMIHLHRLLILWERRGKGSILQLFCGLICPVVYYCSHQGQNILCSWWTNASIYGYFDDLLDAKITKWASIIWFNWFPMVGVLRIGEPVCLQRKEKTRAHFWVWPGRGISEEKQVWSHDQLRVVPSKWLQSHMRGKAHHHLLCLSLSESLREQ